MNTEFLTLVLIYLASVLLAWLCMRKALLLNLESLEEFKFPVFIIVLPVFGLILSLVVLVTTYMETVSSAELLRKVFMLPKKPDKKA